MTAPHPECHVCGGSGICGYGPDAYYDCPSCTGEPVDLQETVDDRPYYLDTQERFDR